MGLTRVSAAAKRLSSRDRVYIRWARSRRYCIHPATGGYPLPYTRTFASPRRTPDCRLRRKWDLSSDGYRVRPPLSALCAFTCKFLVPDSPHFSLSLFLLLSSVSWSRLTREPSGHCAPNTRGSLIDRMWSGAF